MSEPKPGSEIIMMGKRERVAGWKGELFVAIVKTTDDKETKYQVVCDSTEGEDLGNLPKTKIFSNQMEAFTYAMEMERSKSKWRSGAHG